MPSEEGSPTNPGEKENVASFRTLIFTSSRIVRRHNFNHTHTSGWFVFVFCRRFFFTSHSSDGSVTGTVGYLKVAVLRVVVLSGQWLRATALITYVPGKKQQLPSPIDREKFMRCCDRSASKSDVFVVPTTGSRGVGFRPVQALSL